MKINRINYPNQNTGFKGLFDPNILITGGTGYIGSHLVQKLAEDNYNCVVCCRSKNKQEYLKQLVDEVNKSKEDKSICSFVNVDLTKPKEIDNLFKFHYPIDAVLHLGGSTLNGESLVNPKKYYDNNVIASKNLLDTMLDNDIKKFLYLSTASIYAKPGKGKVSEKRTPEPKTPYAKTKFITEMMINDYKVYDLKSTILRLFNVAGAHGPKDLDIGKNVVTFLLNIIKQGGLFTLQGNKYPTKDGTCVKDFIHVDDVTEAISRSTQVLLDSQTDSKTYNVGTGAGTSLGELINKSINITGKQVNLRIIDNLKDEVPYLVANNSAIKRETGWIPKKNVEDIIESCWKWIIRR